MTAVTLALSVVACGVSIVCLRRANRALAEAQSYVGIAVRWQMRHDQLEQRIASLELLERGRTTSRRFIS